MSWILALALLVFVWDAKVGPGPNRNVGNSLHPTFKNSPTPSFPQRVRTFRLPNCTTLEPGPTSVIVELPETVDVVPIKDLDGFTTQTAEKLNLPYEIHTPGGASILYSLVLSSRDGLPAVPEQAPEGLRARLTYQPWNGISLEICRDDATFRTLYAWTDRFVIRVSGSWSPGNAQARLEFEEVAFAFLQTVRAGPTAKPGDFYPVRTRGEQTG